jgi:hypothetical protein
MVLFVEIIHLGTAPMELNEPRGLTALLAPVPKLKIAAEDCH